MAKSTKEAPKQALIIKTSENGNGTSASGRLQVNKTYKLYIDGKFPRSESGRYLIMKNAEGQTYANYCQASRKDFRDAVVVARKAQEGWAKRSAYNKGQILYRMAEVLEGRTAQFVSELVDQGMDKGHAQADVRASVDRLVYYAGWTDKFIQVFSSVNPVESSHFNFSVPEPTGIVCALAPASPGLLGLVSVMAPIIAGGNAAIILASEKYPLTSITFAEVLNSSDLPGGVVNLLTGHKKELLSHFASHMDVNAFVLAGQTGAEMKLAQETAAINVKRTIDWECSDWFAGSAASPYHIMDCQEIKTTWHPIGL